MRAAFRVDASLQIGVGHLVRCLTLADALRTRGVRSRFLCRQLTDATAGAIIAHGHELARLRAAAQHPAGSLPQEADAEESATLLGGETCDWLVIDHYALAARWERRLRPVAARIVVLDDLADRAHDCDVLIDQNLHADAAGRYADKVPTGTRLLLGPRYALLRDEFREARRRARPRECGVRRMLVAFGGTDPANYTALALEALRALPVAGDVGVDVAIGADHPARAELARACEAARYTLHVQPENMAELMLAADLAIGAAGSMSWERCCVGLPCLAMAVADNQRQLLHEAALAGVVYAPRLAARDTADLARHVRVLLENPLLLDSMSRNALSLVDGAGTQRVLRAMGVLRVTVRPATAADARRLFEWRDHPQVRQVSRSSAPLEWREHCAWLESTLRDPHRLLLVGECDGAAIGTVRFDVSDTRAEVSIYVAPAQVGAGLGAELLLAAEHWLQRCRPDVHSLQAEVLEANAASHRLFSGAGYRSSSVRYMKVVS